MSKESDALTSPEIRQLRSTLAAHPVFSAIRSREHLCRFMEIHVFAVWDFMSLVKRLQRDLTCVSLPWVAPLDPAAARLINDIVLAEESDIDAEGHPASHLDLYLEAMREVGASTRVFEEVARQVRGGCPMAEALDHPEVPHFVRDFVSHTMDVAARGSTLEVMASFFHGRENVIPAMFEGLLRQWRIDEAQAPKFVYYLRRHIELDSDEHGPAAALMIERALARDPDQLGRARATAIESLRARSALWDGTLDVLGALQPAEGTPDRLLVAIA